MKNESGGCYEQLGRVRALAGAQHSAHSCDSRLVGPTAVTSRFTCATGRRSLLRVSAGALRRATADRVSRTCLPRTSNRGRRSTRSAPHPLHRAAPPSSSSPSPTAQSAPPGTARPGPDRTAGATAGSRPNLAPANEPIDMSRQCQTQTRYLHRVVLIETTITATPAATPLPVDCSVPQIDCYSVRATGQGNTSALRRSQRAGPCSARESRRVPLWAVCVDLSEGTVLFIASEQVFFSELCAFGSLCT